MTGADDRGASRDTDGAAAGGGTVSGAGKVGAGGEAVATGATGALIFPATQSAMVETRV